MCKTCVLNADNVRTSLRTKPALSAAKFFENSAVGISAGFTSFYTPLVRYVVHMNCSFTTSVKLMLSTISTVPTNTTTKLKINYQYN